MRRSVAALLDAGADPDFEAQAAGHTEVARMLRAAEAG